MKPNFPYIFVVFFSSFCWFLVYFPRFFHPRGPVNPVKGDELPVRGLANVGYGAARSRTVRVSGCSVESLELFFAALAKVAR